MDQSASSTSPTPLPTVTRDTGDTLAGEAGFWSDCVSHPLTGELVPGNDPDRLIAHVADCKRQEESLRLSRQAAIVCLLRITEHQGVTTKTRRIRGRTHRAKLEMPGVTFDQSILKEAWHAYPQYRDELLRIGSVSVKAREFAKAKNEAAPADVSAFVQMIAKAEREPTGLPTVTIEEGGEGEASFGEATFGNVTDDAEGGDL